MITKTLLIGCGDIAIRLTGKLPRECFEFHGLRRQVDALPSHIRGIAWDLNERHGLEERTGGFDLVVITPVPSSRDEAGYRQAYQTNLAKVVRALEASAPKPKLVLLVSSTAVYSQQDGEWVDENSATDPDNFRGQALLAGETLLRESSLEHSVVRFSGIYGPGRERLIQQVLRGETSPRDEDFSNRIHSEDGAGVLAHLIERKLAGDPVYELYLASDSEPATLGAVKAWLAKQMSIATVFRESGESAGGKRCCNERLLASGFAFRYPGFREGYAEMLRAGRTGG